MINQPDSTMSSFQEASNHPFFGSSSSVPPFEEAPTSAGLHHLAPHSARFGQQGLRAGWRRLSTGLRGARLYAVTRPGGGVYWFAEVGRDGVQLNRRFASELQARAWLISLLRPVRAACSFQREEFNGGPWSGRKPCQMSDLSTSGV